MKVAFYGGSFNPPHVGHVLAAAYALSVGFDKVLAVVVASHAFPKELAAFEHRARMAELAFAPISGVEVSRVEASLPSPSYTLQTLQLLHEQHPSWDLQLLVGSDVLADVERWHAFDEVKKLAPLFLLARAGHPSEELPTLLPEVSSTEIRARLGQNPKQDAWLSRVVPKGVLRYIEEHQLYGTTVTNGQQPI